MEWLAEGIMVTILGVATVFAILIVISLVIYITSMAVQNTENKTTEKKKEAKAPVKAAPASKAAKQSVNTDEELIAVITAAIATAENAQGSSISPDKLVVRSLRRVNNWNKEAIQEQQNSLF